MSVLWSGGGWDDVIAGTAGSLAGRWETLGAPTTAAQQQRADDHEPETHYTGNAARGKRLRFGSLSGRARAGRLPASWVQHFSGHGPGAAGDRQATVIRPSFYNRVIIEHEHLNCRPGWADVVARGRAS